MTFTNMFLNEEIKVSKNTLGKYLKMIQKATRARNYNVETVQGGVEATFTDRSGKEFSFLFDGSKMIGYSIDGVYRIMPSNYSSLKDALADFNSRNGFNINTPEASIKQIFRQAKRDQIGVELEARVIDNDKYYGIQEGRLIRIYAKKKFGNVKADQKGGLIEKESNLSSKGNCWVYNEAKVYGDAKVFDKAKVFDSAEVYGRAKVYGSAEVSGSAEVYDAMIFENAKVYEEAKVYDNARVSGSAEVSGSTKVYNSAKVYGDVEIYGDAEVYDDVEIYDRCLIFGRAKVYGNARVYGDTEIYGKAKVYGRAKVYDNVKVYDNSRIFGVSKIGGDTNVSGDTVLLHQILP